MQENNDKNDRGLLIKNEANHKTVEWHLSSTEKKQTNKKTFYNQKKNVQKIKTKIKTLTKQVTTERNQC